MGSKKGACVDHYRAKRAPKISREDCVSARIEERNYPRPKKKKRVLPEIETSAPGKKKRAIRPSGSWAV